MALRGSGISLASAASLSGAPMASGEWDTNVPFAGVLGGVTVNTHYAMPYIPRQTFVCDRGAIRISTGAAGLAKIGIYNSTAAKVPGTKIAEAAADIDTTTPAVLEVGWIANPTLIAGQLYWLTCVVSVSGLSAMGWNPATIHAGGYQMAPGFTTSTQALGGANPFGRYQIALTYGPPATEFLPSSFGSGSYQAGAPGSPLVALRRL